jgi:hypothetical protein
MDIERWLRLIAEQLEALAARQEKWQEEADAREKDAVERRKRMEKRRSELEAQYTAWRLAADKRAKREIGLIRAELGRGVRDSVEEQRRYRGGNGHQASS